MTFIPSVLSKTDTNNSVSTSAASFNGTSTRTVGYNQIQISLQTSVSSNPLGLTVSFSSDGITFTTMYSDSVLANTNYYRAFPVLNTFYRVGLTLTGSGTINLETRLSTTDSFQKSYYENSENSFYDAFSKLRVSNPFSILDIRFPPQTIASGTSVEIRENFLLVYSKTTGSYSATYEKSKVVITGTGTGGYISQSRQYAIYQPGKSQLFLASGVIQNMTLGGGTSGSPDHSAYIGIFDDNNGVFFSFDSVNRARVVLRKGGVDTQILQTNWNIDPMNGTGKSGLNLDFTKTQLFVIDFEWLGVGRVRYGFYAFGQIFYCHQILNINQLTEAYMTSCNLPIRYQLVGRNGTANSATLIQICSSVISEGGYNPAGRPFAVSLTNSKVALKNNIETYLLALRYKSTANHENIVPTSSTVICTTNDIVIFRVRIFPADTNLNAFSGWTSVNNNSVMEYTTADLLTTLDTTGSVIVDEGYVVSKNSSTYEGLATIFKLVQVTANVDNTSDILVLSVFNPGQSNLTVWGGLTWQEAY